MKKKILWISPFIPYDKVPHAGGKVHNYYIKYFKKNIDCEIKLLTFAKKTELSKLDLNKYDIDCEYIIKDKSLITIFIRKLLNLESNCNPFHKFGGGIMNFDIYGFKKMIKKYYKDNYENTPDYIILQWTQAGLMIDYLKKLYPNSIYTIIEEDVSFQGVQRKVDLVENSIIKVFYKIRGLKYKNAELLALNHANIVTVNNFKDRELLLNEKINSDKIIQVVPYFDNKVHIKTEPRNKNILFYGAMHRAENYLSAIWFIEKVFYQLYDNNINFIIIGSNPNKRLLKYKSERIQITGFVDNVEKYFKNSLCMVAPLLLGAGIKVKILEALSSGLPVLTNNIGVEGIGIIDGIHYLNCSTPEEYIKAINSLIKDITLQKQLEKNGKQFILDNFDINTKLDELIKKMNTLR